MSETKAAKGQRLAEALRANLRRRKAAVSRSSVATDAQARDTTAVTAETPDAGMKG